MKPTKFNEQALEYYKAGILDANEHNRITIAARSKRALELMKKHGGKIGKQSILNMDAYNAGVAFEVNRQTRLEFQPISATE